MAYAEQMDFQDNIRGIGFDATELMNGQHLAAKALDDELPDEDEDLDEDVDDLDEEDEDEDEYDDEDDEDDEDEEEEDEE